MEKFYFNALIFAMSSGDSDKVDRILDCAKACRHVNANSLLNFRRFWNESDAS